MNALIVSILGVSLVTSLVALALSFLFNQLKGKISIRTKYFLWLGLLVSLLLPFRPQFGRGVVKVQSEPLAIPLREAPLVPKQLPAKEGLLGSFFDLPWLQILLVIWLLGAVIVFGLQLYRSWKFYRLLNRWSQPVTDQRILDSLEGTKELLALTTPVKVSHYHLSPTPMLTGFKHPHILLPSLDYTDEELDLIFEHELTHFKHHDVYVNLLIMLVTSLYWFNPLVSFIGRETQEAGESYCDHDVLAQQDKAYRTFYGETIITMIGKSHQKTVGLSSCFYSDKFKLKRRMEAIVNTELSTKWLTGLAVALVASSVLFSGSVFAMVESSPVLQEQIRQSSLPSDAELKEELSRATGVAVKDMADWTKTKTDAGYDISFSHDGKTYAYTYLKATGELNLATSAADKATDKTSSDQATKDKAETKDSSSNSTQSASDSANTNTQQSTQNNQASQSNQNTAASTPAETVTQAPAASSQVVQQPVQQQVVEQPVVQTPAPAVTYTPATPTYSYDDDDDYDDDYDDDDDDD